MNEEKEKNFVDDAAARVSEDPAIDESCAQASSDNSVKADSPRGDSSGALTVPIARRVT